MKYLLILACCLAAVAVPVFAQQEKQPPPPPPPPPKNEVITSKPPVILSDKDMTGFYKRNPEVAEITWESKKKVEVHFRDKEKKTEVYDFNNKTDEVGFNQKYGEPPIPLAPPPPPPKNKAVTSKPPVILSDKDMTDFYKRNPEVAEITWESKKKVEVHFRDKEKKTEVYDLTNKTDEASFNQKYGEPPIPPGPPMLPPPKPKKKEVI